MSREDDIPIEPLSEASWNRIERGLWEELDDRARVPAGSARASWPRWALPAIAAALLVQVAVAALLLVRSDPAQKPLATARFESGRAASDATFGDVALHLEPSSTLVVIDDGAHGSLCVLERGAVRFSVPSRGARPPFVVQAGEARVEVVGTRFRVERVAGTAVVETYEGKVRVSARGQTRLVTRGGRWSGASGGAGVGAGESVGAGAGVSGSAGVSESGSESESAGVSASGSAVTRVSDDRRARFEQAAAWEAKEPQQALRIYHALARERGPWARNALYAAGRLELELGERERAERALRSYLKRFPDGANAGDARALLQRLNSGARAPARSGGGAKENEQP